MVMWVCEAWQVNIWTVLAVRPNGPKNKKDNNFASSRSDHLGSDKHIKFEHSSVSSSSSSSSSLPQVLSS